MTTFPARQYGRVHSLVPVCFGPCLALNGGLGQQTVESLALWRLKHLRGPVYEGSCLALLLLFGVS